MASKQGDKLYSVVTSKERVMPVGGTEAIKIRSLPNSRENTIQHINENTDKYFKGEFTLAWGLLAGEEPVALIEQTFLPLIYGSSDLLWCITWERRFLSKKTFYL